MDKFTQLFLGDESYRSAVFHPKNLPLFFPLRQDDGVTLAGAVAAVGLMYAR